MRTSRVPELSAIVNEIRARRRFVISSHARPDGDSIGSQLAMAYALKALGKDVTITVHPGTGHAFMAPHNALGTRDDEAYARIWPQAVGFLHEHLG